MLPKVLRAAIAILLVGCFATPVFADGTVAWTGQGVTDGQLNTVVCGVENGAEVDGPYLLWVFTAARADSATITINGDTFPMSQEGQGAFKYVSGWYDLDTVVASASYVGEAQGSPQLVISHGCPPQTPEWCSPGYWRQEHHLDSWEATGISPDELYSAYFGAPTLSKKGVADGANPNPTLWDVLQSPQWYGGDAFNNVGDLLSDAHPDVNFTGERVEDSCPLN